MKSLKPEQKIRTSREVIQYHHKYYAETASVYDQMHVSADDEHYVALKYLTQLADGSDISSVLDVGCGTGRAMKYLSERGIDAWGLEPVPELIGEAISKHGLDVHSFVCGTGENLPFAAQSFDAVCEFGMLHHVPDSEKVVKEMMRVARKAIFISDSNRFGQGRMIARLVKLSLAKTGLWRPFNFIKTRGKGYTILEGDGLTYSYSVYDSYRQLAEWATKIILIPTSPQTTASWSQPLLTSAHVLLCAFREE